MLLTLVRHHPDHARSHVPRGPGLEQRKPDASGHRLSSIFSLLTFFRNSLGRLEGEWVTRMNSPWPQMDTHGQGGDLWG